MISENLRQAKAGYWQSYQCGFKSSLGIPVSESGVTGGIALVTCFLSEDELPFYCSSPVTHTESICTTICLAGNADSLWGENGLTPKEWSNGTIVIITYFCKVPLIVKNPSTDYIRVHVGINQSPLQGMWQPFCISNAAQKHFREVKNSFSKYTHRKRMLCRKKHQDTFINICIFK